MKHWVGIAKKFKAMKEHGMLAILAFKTVSLHIDYMAIFFIMSPKTFRVDFFVKINIDIVKGLSEIKITISKGFSYRKNTILMHCFFN